MTYQEKVFRLIYITFWSMCFYYLGVFILNHFGCIGTDDSDYGPYRRSGVKIIHDAKTGMQYLAFPNGGITPRLDSNGKQIYQPEKGCK